MRSSNSHETSSSSISEDDVCLSVFTSKVYDFHDLLKNVQFSPLPNQLEFVTEFTENLLLVVVRQLEMRTSGPAALL